MANGVGFDLAAVRQLMARSEAELDSAAASRDAAMQFLHAHMAAIRTAAAVLAMSPVRPRRRRMLSAWDQLAELGPQWQPWAQRFAAGARLRSAIEAGRSDVDETVAAAALMLSQEFHDLVNEVASAARSSDIALAS
ncbi:MAG: SAV_6107 family HEPN domain-containing protein [Beutenbergiaceae bacterium]